VAELHRGEALAERVECGRALANRAPAEQSGLLHACDAQLEPGERLRRGAVEAGGEAWIGQSPLDADREERRVLDGEAAEDDDAGFDEVGDGIFGYRPGFDLRLQQLEPAPAERDEQALFRPEDRVHGPRCGPDGVCNRSHRERLEPVGLDDPLRRTQQRVRGGSVVAPGASHGGQHNGTVFRYAACSTETSLRNRRLR